LFCSRDPLQMFTSNLTRQNQLTQNGEASIYWSWLQAFHNTLASQTTDRKSINRVTTTQHCNAQTETKRRFWHSVCCLTRSQCCYERCNNVTLKHTLCNRMTALLVLTSNGHHCVYEAASVNSSLQHRVATQLRAGWDWRLELDKYRLCRCRYHTDMLTSKISAILVYIHRYNSTCLAYRQSYISKSLAKRQNGAVA